MTDQQSKVEKEAKTRLPLIVICVHTHSSCLCLLSLLTFWHMKSRLGVIYRNTSQTKIIHNSHSWRVIWKKSLRYCLVDLAQRLCCNLHDSSRQCAKIMRNIGKVPEQKRSPIVILPKTRPEHQSSLDSMQRRRQRNDSITQQTEFIKTEQPLIGYAGDPTDSDPGYEVKRNRGNNLVVHTNSTTTGMGTMGKF